MAKKSINDIRLEDLVNSGLNIEEAEEVERVIKDVTFGAKGSDPIEVWRLLVSRKVLKPSHPHSLHQLLYYSVYADWDISTKGLPLYWFPSL